MIEWNVSTHIAYSASKEGQPLAEVLHGKVGIEISRRRQRQVGPIDSRSDSLKSMRVGS
jgi:hypothetical protein